MSILKYFNHTLAIIQDQGLPEPTSSLSNFVSPKAIELANTEVEKVKNKGPQGARSASQYYLILTPVQRFQAGKRAAEHGITAWLHVTKFRKCSLCFTEYVSVQDREFHDLPNFLPPMCSCNEFATFSRCLSFPLYGINFQEACMAI